jgi:predicted amidohydrolase
LAHGDEAVLHAEIDLSRTADYRDAFPVLADRRL